jgi:hypothetical protein
MKDQGKQLFSGHLRGNDRWLRAYVADTKGDLTRYLARGGE